MCIIYIIEPHQMRDCSNGRSGFDGISCTHTHTEQGSNLNNSNSKACASGNMGGR